METKRKALGKGLEQLFTNERIDFDNFEKGLVEESRPNEIREIKLDEIRSNPYQPRKVFDDESLQELASSIKEHGVVQPVIVKKSIKGYELVAGERRTRACRLAGLKTVPAVVKDFNDQEMMEIALIENIQRENLNPIEEANAYLNILNSTNMTQEELAKKFGKSRSYITNLLGLLKLPESTKKLVEEQKISMGHARALSKLEDQDEIVKLADQIIMENLNVRDIENIARGINTPKYHKVKKSLTRNHSPYVLYETLISEKTGTKVRISDHKIEIPFDSAKDLERILEILNITFEE